MSKIITLTSELIEKACVDFAKSMMKYRSSDGKISYTSVLPGTNEKACVYFEPTAWTKMLLLLSNFDKEVAWHGVASRLDGDEHEYVISDIVVYPQEVTGTNVEMDEVKYTQWLIENDGDERFNNLRMQGHSHVNMSVFPSGVDLQHQEDILAQVGDDSFYIFMIYNKRLEHNIKIYDMRKNLMFDNADITVSIVGDGESLEEFVSNAKSLVTTKSYSYQSQKPTGYIGGKNSSPTPKNNDKPKTSVGNNWRSSKGSEDEEEDEFSYYQRIYGIK